MFLLSEGEKGGARKIGFGGTANYGWNLEDGGKKPWGPEEET